MKIDWENISIKDLGALVCHKLNEQDIDAVLVGGACVSVYTKNKYLSSDLDFVSHATLKEIARVLEALGFNKESPRHFKRNDCPFFIEIVAPPVAVGNKPVTREKEIKTKLGKLILLTPTDSVMDRLAAYYHWDDAQALDQAVMVAKAQVVNLREIKKWSVAEGHKDKYEDFLKELKK